jgi:FkbM family methyltransferase
MWRRAALPIKRANRAVGRRLGVAIGHYPTRESLDAELNRIIRHFMVDTIVDVGAHLGGFAMQRRLLGYEGRIISFEPFGASFAKLALSAEQDPTWDVHEIALGSSDQTAEFHIFTDDQMNSLRVLSDHASRFDKRVKEVASVETRIRRLDTIWPSLRADPATTLLKIDTQGHDLEVIEGAGDLLTDIQCVLTEVPVQPLYSGAPLFEEVMAKMRSLGFELTGAFPIRRYEGVRVIEFDCTFCRVS